MTFNMRKDSLIQSDLKIPLSKFMNFSILAFLTAERPASNLLKHN